MAKSIVLNLVYCVNTYGFVPNGLRSYYLNRSQPPLLASMVKCVYDETKNEEFLRRGIEGVKKELEWWRMGPRSSFMAMEGNGCVGEGGGGDGDGGTIPPPERFLVTRYFASWDRPRPESYKEDVLTSGQGHSNTNADMQSAARCMYREIASAAESGWDFSSRWFEDGMTMETIRTTRVIPVDLNALLYKSEKILSRLLSHVGDAHGSREWKEKAAQRYTTIQRVLWDEGLGRWRDRIVGNDDTILCFGGVGVGVGVGAEDTDTYNVGTSPATATVIEYASDFVPLWCLDEGEVEGDVECRHQTYKAVQSLRSSVGLYNCIGGIPASTQQQSGQQWDWPNVWPPVQSMLAEGCAGVGEGEGGVMARQIVRKFLRTAFVGWKRTGKMFEKFGCGGVG